MKTTTNKDLTAKVVEKKALVLFNWYTDREIMSVPLRDAAGKISYVTHPNNKRKTKLGSRPLSLAELLRMPSPKLKTLLSTFKEIELRKLKAVVVREHNKERLNDACFAKFQACSQELLTKAA